MDSNFLLTETLSSREKFMKCLYERGESFAQLLPYQEVVQKSGIHILKDGSLGAVFEMDLLQHETMDVLSITEATEGLKSWFQLPENCSLQVLFDQSFIPKRDKIWNQKNSNFDEGHPVSSEIHKSRMNMFRDQCESNSVLSPMRRVAYLSLRFFPNSVGSKSGLKNLIRSANSASHILFSAMDELKDDLLEFQQLLAQFEESSKIKLQKLTAEKLTDYLRRFFNPKEYINREFAEYNSSLPISEQVIYSGPRGFFEGIEREGIKTRTITLKTSPLRVFPGGMANFLKIKFPFKIAVNFSFPPKSKIKGYFDFKEFFLQNTPSARAKRQQTELKQIQERLAHDERCVFMTFSVVIEAVDEETLNQYSRSITSIFNNELECEVIKEERIGFGLCLNALPLFYSPASDLSSQRYIRIMTKDAAKLLPIFDSFRGIDIPMQHFLSRENNLVPFSWANNDICNHMAILGDTGSGKSKFALDCVQAYKRKSPEPIVFVIDKRASCKALCDQFGGELITFDPHQDIPFSVFRGVFDDKKIQFLMQLFFTAIQLTSQEFLPDSRHIAIISRSLKEAYLRRAREQKTTFDGNTLVPKTGERQVRVSMDDVVASMSSLTAIEEFEKMKDQINDLLTRFNPFYGDGVYAPFFRAPKDTEELVERNLYGYDLEALDVDPTLRVLMSMCVINEILVKMGQPESLKRGGILYVEELGCLGRDNQIVGQFIREAAERMRKMGFWLIGVAPTPKIFFETEAGQAVWQASQHFCFLNMGLDNIKYLKEKSDMLNPIDLEIIGTLKTIASEYAEVYYVNKFGNTKGAFRYVQSQRDRTVSVNSFHDQSQIEKLKENA